MPADLIVYALVAAGLVFWLKNVLGTRHGEERERPDPFASQPEETAVNLERSASAPLAEGQPEHNEIEALAAETAGPLGIENKTAEIALLEIAEADKNFDIKFFLEAAQDVFVMGVEGFGEGDRELLGDLLSDEVYNAFDGAIAAREKSGETLSNEIHAIKKTEVTAAKLDGKMASITVRFIASETSITKDKDGEIIAGHPDKVTEMRDIWTFARDIKSRDPRWLVTETRGDFDEDNETIPNTVE